MPFFTYRQNNSFGVFHEDFDKGIGGFVIIEAPNPNVANALAQSKGIYFYGVDGGVDCQCCGDRWDEAFDWEPGTDRPEVYGRPVVFDETDEPGGNAFVHFLDGRILYGLVPRRKALTDD